MKFWKLSVISTMMTTLVMGPAAMAVPTTDTVSAVLNLSGNVPVVFSLQARGVPGDLDLSPNAYVFNRTIGVMHFKVNASIDKIYLLSDNAAGKPYNASGNAPVATFLIGTRGACTLASLTPASINATAPGTDIVTAGGGALTTGVEEDCELVATWTGAAALLPLSGLYHLALTITMISK